MKATLFALLSFSTLVRGGFLNGDCELRYSNGQDVEYMEWLYDLFLHPQVPDTSPPNTEIARFSTSYIKKITSYQSKYVNVILSGKYLILTLRDRFVDFEELETEPDIKINIDFECNEGTARIAMWATVEDSNNHYPRFLNGAPYTYTLPLPFPPGIPLACVTSTIAAAEDVDLSTTMLVFQVRGTDALRVDGSWRVGRAFHVNISTTRYITAPINATLVATDNGYPALDSETQLFIKADTKLSSPHIIQEVAAAQDRQDHPTKQ